MNSENKVSVKLIEQYFDIIENNRESFYDALFKKDLHSRSKYARTILNKIKTYKEKVPEKIRKEIEEKRNTDIDTLEFICNYIILSK